MLKIYDQILSKFMTKMYDQKLLAHLHLKPSQPTNGGPEESASFWRRLTKG